MGVITYAVPEKYGGMNLRDIHKELLKSGLGTGLGSLGTAAGFLGINETQPLEAGQRLTANLPEQYMGGSSEYLGFQKAFTPYEQYQKNIATQQQQDFQQEERDRLAEFTGKLEEVPIQLEAVGKALGLPEAYETYRTAGETARSVGQFVEDLPESVRLALEGKGLSAGQIAGRTSKELRELAPTITAAERGLTGAGSALQSLLSQYQTETANIFTPLEIESGLLGDNIAQEFDLFKTNIQAELDRELQQLRNASALEIAQLQESGEMARLERTAEINEAAREGKLEDLGDRIALINPYSGNEVASFSKGLAPTRGTTGSIAGELGTLWEQWKKMPGG